MTLSNGYITNHLVCCLIFVLFFILINLAMILTKFYWWRKPEYPDLSQVINKFLQLTESMKTTNESSADISFKSLFMLCTSAANNLQQQVVIKYSLN
jgi:hypothetical protein